MYVCTSDIKRETKSKMKNKRYFMNTMCGCWMLTHDAVLASGQFTWREIFNTGNGSVIGSLTNERIFFKKW